MVDQLCVQSRERELQKVEIRAERSKKGSPLSGPNPRMGHS